jgi:hypothetical protein
VGDEAAYRDAPKWIHKGDNRFKNPSSDILEVNIDAIRTRGFEVFLYSTTSLTVPPCIT